MYNFGDGLPLSAQSNTSPTIPQLSCPTSVLSSPHNMLCRVLLPKHCHHQPSRSFQQILSLPMKLKKCLSYFITTTYYMIFSFWIFLICKRPHESNQQLHLHQTKSCCNYKSTYLFASNLSFAKLNHFKLLSLFQFLHAH